MRSYTIVLELDGEFVVIQASTRTLIKYSNVSIDHAVDAFRLTHFPNAKVYSVGLNKLGVEVDHDNG